MVAQRRFGPLIATLFVGLCVVFARLFQVQVVEHEVWAQQANGLTRSARTLPSHRGSFVDRNGRTLVRDEDLYRIEFRYRDFRRGHALGILAHARSSIEMRAVPLSAALDHRTEWTQELVRLSPRDLDLFEKGEALARGTIAVPKVAEPSRDLRYARASDVRFYIGALLDLSKEESNGLRKLEDDARAISYVEFAARARKVPTDALLQSVVANVDTECADLTELADILEVEAQTAQGGGSAPSGRGLDALITLFENVRHDIDDSGADELFRAAAGFDAGLVSTDSLESMFDLDWIGRALRWDAARMHEWTASRRVLRMRRLDEAIVPRILVQLELETPARRPDRLLDELALLWTIDRERDEDGRPPSWRDLDDLVVLDQMNSLFASARLPAGVVIPKVVLPFQDEELRALAPNDAAPWKTVGLVSDLAGKSDSGEDEPLREPDASALWEELGDSRADLESDTARLELRRLVHALDRRHRAAADRLFAGLMSARRAEDGTVSRLEFSEERRKRADTQDKYDQPERGNRSMHLFAEPTYALVERIARSPERYRGFEVRESTRRVQLVKDQYGEPCASLLLGGVRKPMLRELLGQSADERRMIELRSMLLRSAAEDLELRDLALRIQQPDERTGDSGLEDYLDPELRGKPGWLETQGLEERARNEAGALAVAPQNGLDVGLTLDSELQLAAQSVITHPRMPGDGVNTDRAFFQHPVGAIVLLSVDGDVLAAASSPVTNGEPTVPGRDRERGIRRERTLQRPTFNPPGSVFKPFVAAYAVDRLGFDPEHQYECKDLGKGRGGFETMHCLGIHGSSDLRRALTVSCNSYFAQLGTVYDVDQFIAMAHTFGFGEPTGIKCFGSKGRSGLREEGLMRPDAEMRTKLASREAHLRFANGLGLMDANPMQVARATAGIATGRLPTVRLVRSVGDHEIPMEGRELGLSERSLAFVRSAMRNVVDGGDGSAHGKGVDASTLGFTFACKTGSGDYLSFRDIPELPSEDRRALEAGKMRKHTWIAGWFPAEAPQAILVVYLHDVSETASHTAVYVAAQFLQSEAVKHYVAEACAKAAR